MDSNIIRSWNGKTIRQREDGYMCLTDMAQACGKEFKHWNSNDKAKSYLATLSAVVGIPTTDLIQIKQGGVPELQGTWGHRKVSIRFAQWCSDEFAVQVDCWVEELMTTGKVEFETPKQTKTQVNLDDLKHISQSLLDAGIDKALVQGFHLNCLGKARPELIPFANEAHKLLAATTEIPEIFLPPTAVGQSLNISARQVNKLLLELGYQVKNPLKASVAASKTLPDYIATTKGELYAVITMATGSNIDNTTYQHLKWRESIVSILSEYVGV